MFLTAGNRSIEWRRIGRISGSSSDLKLELMR